MAEQRKPPNVKWETHIESQIREARERGDFDNLPGQGQPIPGLDQAYDELWWIKQWLKREELAIPVASLELGKQVDRVLEAIQRMPDERQVRAAIDAINEKIRRANATQITGPPSRIAMLNRAQVIDRWRQHRLALAEKHKAPAPQPASRNIGWSFFRRRNRAD